jgi:hypothetical protein
VGYAASVLASKVLPTLIKSTINARILNGRAKALAAIASDATASTMAIASYGCMHCLALLVMFPGPMYDAVHMYHTFMAEALLRLNVGVRGLRVLAVHLQEAQPVLLVVTSTLPKQQPQQMTGTPEEQVVRMFLDAGDQVRSDVNVVALSSAVDAMANLFTGAADLLPHTMAVEDLSQRPSRYYALDVHTVGMLKDTAVLDKNTAMRLGIPEDTCASSTPKVRALLTLAVLFFMAHLQLYGSDNNNISWHEDYMELMHGLQVHIHTLTGAWLIVPYRYEDDDTKVPALGAPCQFAPMVLLTMEGDAKMRPDFQKDTMAFGVRLMAQHLRQAFKEVTAPKGMSGALRKAFQVYAPPMQ